MNTKQILKMNSLKSQDINVSWSNSAHRKLNKNGMI